MPLEMQIQYFAICDIYARVSAKIVESHPDKNEICSETHRLKVSESSLVDRRKLKRAQGIGRSEDIPRRTKLSL